MEHGRRGEEPGRETGWEVVDAPAADTCRSGYPVWAGPFFWAVSTNRRLTSDILQESGIPVPRIQFLCTQQLASKRTNLFSENRSTRRDPFKNTPSDSKYSNDETYRL
uniref:p0648C09.13 protein n=1 Tax=Oryza sativa subsp. japonica TaxID=39947 RepID=Q8RYY7_ORYSJ|nr:P0648C09.13 [Oryza sativa Japonica Group]